jgi:hypothetical protein
VGGGAGLKVGGGRVEAGDGAGISPPADVAVGLAAAMGVALGAAMGVGAAGATPPSQATSSSASASAAQPWRKVLRIVAVAGIGWILSGRRAIRT